MDLIRPMSPALADYQFDESRTMGHAEWIAFPACEEEVLEVLGWCRQQRVPVTAQGALTGLAGGASPQRGLALNFSRMNRIVGLRRDADGRALLTVEPGLRLAALRRALAEKAFDVRTWNSESKEALMGLAPGALFFPPDPTEPAASIGGMAACNACGARSFRYGCTRAHVHGLRVALSDGRVLDLQRGRDRADDRHVLVRCTDGSPLEFDLPGFDTPPIKDAGYLIRPDMDLVDLFMGSQGTLGILLRLELILERAPRHLWGLTAFLPDDECALRYVRALKGRPDAGVPAFPHRPTAIEYFGKDALDMVQRQRAITPAFAQLLPLPEDYACAVYAEFAGDDPEETAPMLALLEPTLVASGGDPGRTWVARDARELEALLTFRHSVPETIDLIVEQNRKNEPAITILSTDMAVDDDHFSGLFSLYRADLAASGLPHVIFGHIGENHVHPNVLARDLREYEQGHRLFEKWARDVRRMGGTITAEHGAGKLKKKLAAIMYGSEKLAALRALKQTLDPDDLLGPGNILSSPEEAADG